MKPDYGYFLYETTKKFGPHHFYDILITNIDRIDQTLFTSTVNNVFDRKEFCVSFDIPMSLMNNLLNKILNKEDANNLSKLIATQNKFKYDFLEAFTLNCISCTIGDIYVNDNERYRPLLVSAIS